MLSSHPLVCLAPDFTCRAPAEAGARPCSTRREAPARRVDEQRAVQRSDYLQKELFGADCSRRHYQGENGRAMALPLSFFLCNCSVSARASMPSETRRAECSKPGGVHGLNAAHLRSLECVNARFVDSLRPNLLRSNFRLGACTSPADDALRLKNRLLPHSIVNPCNTTGRTSSPWRRS